jgi:hypothetical protein
LSSQQTASGLGQHPNVFFTASSQHVFLFGQVVNPSGHTTDLGRGLGISTNDTLDADFLQFLLATSHLVPSGQQCRSSPQQIDLDPEQQPYPS